MFPWSRKETLTLDLGQTFSWRELIVKPTPAGYWLFLLAIAVWVGALNYAVSLAYALSFWLLSFLIISVLMVRQQLVGLKIILVESDEVFAGENAKIKVSFQSETKKWRTFYILYDEHSALIQMQDNNIFPVILNIPTSRRGLLNLPEITLFTEGPFGLMKTQLTFVLNEQVIIYPRPEKYNLSVPLSQKDADVGSVRFKGEDDLSSLSEYIVGESLRKISWKNYAKTGKLLSKNFENELSINPKLISYKDYKGASVEQMANFMCQRVLDMEQQKQSYVLELPNQMITAQTNQRIAALNALGLWL